MREFVVFALVALVVFGLAMAFAQEERPFNATPVQPHGSGNTVVSGGGGWGGGYHSSTAAEGKLRGMGDVMRSAGQANLDNSAAAINYTQARQNQITNHAYYTETYFETRAANRAYRAAERGPKVTMEQAVRLAQQGRPARLSPSQVDTVTGSVNWPLLLTTDPYTDDRAEIEAVLAKRASHSAIGYDDVTHLRQTTDQMMAQLKTQVRDVRPDQYMAARKFLESLSYEATRPAG